MRKANLKRIFGVFATMATTAAIACNPFALDSETSNAMTTSFTAVKSDSISALAIIAPIAIGIMAAFLVWRYGKKFFTGLAK